MKLNNYAHSSSHFMYLDRKMEILEKLLKFRGFSGGKKINKIINKSIEIKKDTIN